MRDENVQPQGLAALQLRDERLDGTPPEHVVRTREIDEIRVMRHGDADVGLGEGFPEGDALVVGAGALRPAIRMNPATPRAAFCPPHPGRSHTAGSTAGPPCRISKCRCGGSSGSEMPTPPMTCPLITV